MIVGRIKRGAVATTLIPLLFGFFLALAFFSHLYSSSSFRGWLARSLFLFLARKGSSSQQPFRIFPPYSIHHHPVSHTTHTHTLAHHAQGGKSKGTESGLRPSVLDIGLDLVGTFLLFNCGDSQQLVFWSCCLLASPASFGGGGFYGVTRFESAFFAVLNRGSSWDYHS
jgi:hypothetical protein